VVLRAILGVYGTSYRTLPPTTILLMVGVAVTAVVDQSMARERLWAANLGFGRRTVVVMAASVTLVLETAANLLLSLWAG